MNLLADVDAWAVPVNTFLLIVLAAVGIMAARDRQYRKRDLTDIKNSMGLNRRAYDSKVRDTGHRRRRTDPEMRTNDRVSVPSEADTEIEDTLPGVRGPEE